MVDTTTHRIINQNSCWRFYFNFYRCSVIVNFESKKFITLTVKNINQLHGYMSCKIKFEISLFLFFDSCLKLLTNFIDEDDFYYSWHTGSRIFGICLNFKPWTVHFFFFFPLVQALMQTAVHTKLFSFGNKIPKTVKRCPVFPLAFAIRLYNNTLLVSINNHCSQTCQNENSPGKRTCCNCKGQGLGDSTLLRVWDVLGVMYSRL